MTKQEWLQRCAARYIEKSGVTQEQADDFAEVCYDNEYIEGCPRLVNYTPESCADEDMDEWGRNT